MAEFPIQMGNSSNVKLQDGFGAAHSRAREHKQLKNIGLCRGETTWMMALLVH
jgi:hypothetical protein